MRNTARRKSARSKPEGASQQSPLPQAHGKVESILRQEHFVTYPVNSIRALDSMKRRNVFGRASITLEIAAVPESDWRHQCPLLALSGHWLVRCTCPLMTQSGHWIFATVWVLIGVGRDQSKPGCHVMIKLYDSAFSPFARKVRMTLEYKGLNYEAIDGLLKSNRAALKAVNGRIEVPALVDDGIVVVNSADIVAYLDYRYTEKCVYAADPAARVHARRPSHRLRRPRKGTRRAPVRERNVLNC